MNKSLGALIAIVTAWMLSVSITVTHAQQIDNDKPLGDVAREQRAIHKRQQNGLTLRLTTAPKTGSGPGMLSRSDAKNCQCWCQHPDRDSRFRDQHHRLRLASHPNMWGKGGKAIQLHLWTGRKIRTQTP